MDINLFSLIRPKRCYIQTYPTIFFSVLWKSCYNLLHMWNLDWSNVKFLQKQQRNSTWSAIYIKRDIPKFDTVFTQTRATYGEIRKQNSSFRKGLELWAKSINDFGNLERHFPCATSAKILAAMYARVPQAMAQFVLKIEKLSHIMAPTPILEMARAYGLRPWLWLLL